jgi:hypothetical protein
MTADVTIVPHLPGTGGAVGVRLSQRYLSSDGRYVFFTSSQGLVPRDTNGLPDVYEYDLVAKEVRLLSSGTGDRGSWFEDASADGGNVFFLTKQKLTGWDTDGLIDLYDARVNGGFPEPSAPPVACEGDACQGVPSAAPAFNTASGFSGLGNRRPTTPATSKKKKTKARRHAKRRGHARGKRSRRGGRASGSRGGVSIRVGR